MTALEGARQLAQRICVAAEWRGDRCTWIDAAGKPLDAELYAGNVGVAWFLAQLATITGDQQPANTATAAARYALDRVAERPKPRGGCHDGDPGTLWAAAAIGMRLKDASLTERAGSLLAHVLDRLPPINSGRSDLVGGTAGSLLAILGLMDGMGSVATQHAERLAALLIQSADQMPFGIAWLEPTETNEGRPHTAPARGAIGMAHGASGVAHSLLSLDRKTGRAQFQDAALGAMAFERAWYDRAACAWRDPHTRAPTGVSWCRGSAGIGLVRLAHLDLTAQSRLAAEAGAALAAVHASVAGVKSTPAGALNWEQLNFSLCHGLGGAADLLVHGADVLGVEEHRSAAEWIVEYGLATARDTGRWACGTPDRSESVGLFLGLAGIGAMCLRVAVPGQVPPVGLLVDAHSTS